MTNAAPLIRPLCTVRGCARVLTRSERSWRCQAGHSFDIARSGYVNLLQPGDRRSRSAGDSRAAVTARLRLEEAGLADELVAALERVVGALAPRPGSAALDVGAGSGLLLGRLGAAFGLEGWAIDLSSAAADEGARRRRRLAWVVANADRRLPFADGSFELVLSSAGPKNPAEFRRVLAPLGSLLLIVPASDDLIELRAALLGEGRPIDRASAALERFQGAFDCAERTLVRTRRRLERPAIEDLLAAAYRGGRRRERERLAGLDALDTTLSWEILRLVPRARAPSATRASNARRRVLVLFPTMWDRRYLARGGSERFDVVTAGPDDEECLASFDWAGFLERTAAEHRGGVHGVMSSSDYPGPMLVAVLARELGLPGTPPPAAVAASHKLASRRAQARAVPEATPAFEAIDPTDPRAPSFGFPCFVKPAKGSFSRFARRVDSLEELRAHLLRDEVRDYLETYLGIYHGVARRYGEDGLQTRAFVAEELVEGVQVTLEGWAAGGAVRVAGPVDTRFHAAHQSFARFDYPSLLPEEVALRMEDAARRAARELKLDATAFNVELFYDPVRDRIAIIEINARACGQFGDLYEKVDGVHGFELALAAACGEPPPPGRGLGRYRAAASVPLRAFGDVSVERSPSDDDVRAAEGLFPESLVWNEVHAGQALGPLRAAEDGVSVRYAVVNVGGADFAEVARRAEAIERRLGYVFTRELSRQT